MIIHRTLTIQNERGLHTRPAALIAKTLSTTSSNVTFTHKALKVDAKQILNLLLLQAPQSSEISVSIEGVDAPEVLDKLTQIFESRFGES